MSVVSPRTNPPTAELRSAAAQLPTALRRGAPLVQCLTNYVAMDLTANLLNAVGASPAMVHDVREAAEFAGIADAVCVNIGTLSPPWVEGMLAASDAAWRAGTPWVLDPVAVGATAYRRETALALLDRHPTVIRGNAGEIATLAGATASGRGVDGAEADEDRSRGFAEALAGRLECVVAMTGAVDVVTDGHRTVSIRGGDDRLPSITATGCAASALVAACVAVADPFAGSVGALALISAAAERAGAVARGPGSLRWQWLDALAGGVDDDVADVLARP